MALIDILAALRWWAAIFIIGTAVVPLQYTFFKTLPDKGYAFAKMVGLLLVSYLFWLMGSFGFLANSLGGILFSLVLVTALSIVWYQQQNTGDLFTWLRQNWRYILTVELVFAGLFFLWVWVRAQNPSITATEKPMEFAFLNSATYSPQYPPLDPWLSGFAISYYYFGYIMISVLGRLAAVTPAIAFNLGVSWLVAGSGIGAFGLIYNLVVAQAETDTETTDEHKPTANKTTTLAIVLGLLAAVALPIGGNGQMLWEVLHGNNIGSEQFWQGLDIRDINNAAQETPRYTDRAGEPTSSWWWWRSSRVIHEYHLSGRVEEGLTPIAEFPGFSFILGDMHPHVLALPYAFLGIAVAFIWYRRDYEINNQADQPLWQNLLNFFSAIGWPKILFTAVVVGGLSFLNTWDILVHLFLLVGAFTLARWRQNGRWSPDLLIESVVLGVLFVLLSYLLYMPFYLGFSSQAGAPYILPMLMRPTRVAHYLTIFGLPLFSVTVMIGYLAWTAPQRNKHLGAALTVGLGLPFFLFALSLVLIFALAASASGTGYINGLVFDLGIAMPQRLPETDWNWGIAALTGIFPTYIANRVQYLGVTLFLTTLLTAVVWLWHRTLYRETPADDSQQIAPAASVTAFVLLLVLTGVLLSIGPEFVYLKDNFGQRLNTIFKFYYQTWVLFGVAGLYAVGYLLQRVRTAGSVVTAVYVPLLAVSLLFPYHAVRSRAVEYRGPVSATERQTPTLNGLAFMDRFHNDDYQAVQWITENTSSDDVILETTGNPYSYYARISANSGRPTVLGWANHEFQWRGDSTTEPSARIGVVRELYETLDWQRTTQLLNDYDVAYIYVGGLEVQDHNGRGLEKFAENLDIAYQNQSVTIYRWQAE